MNLICLSDHPCFRWQEKNKTWSKKGLSALSWNPELLFLQRGTCLLNKIWLYSQYPGLHVYSIIIVILTVWYIVLSCQTTTGFVGILKNLEWVTLGNVVLAVWSNWKPLWGGGLHISYLWCIFMIFKRLLQWFSIALP